MYMNAAFDNVCFKGSVLSQSARFVYLCLCKHADNTNQTCFPSLNRIAQIVGKSISTIKRAVRELIKYGVIERSPRFRPDGGQTSNLYKIKEYDLKENYEIETETTCTNENQDEDVSFSESNDPQIALTYMKELTKNSKISEENIPENNFNLNINDVGDSKAKIKDISEMKYTNDFIVTKSTPAAARVNKIILWAKGLKNHLYLIKSKNFKKNDLGGGHGRPSKNLFN